MDVDSMKRQIELADGRLLDAWIDPDESGIPLVFHDGTPSSGMPFGPHVDAAHERGLRWVSWSRPGYGSSTRLENRSVVDVVDDTRDVLNQLAASKAYVGGWSGGGPHTLACAAMLPDRVIGVTIVAGVAPFDAEGLDFLAGMGEENVVEFGAALEGSEKLAEFLEPAWQSMRDLTGPEVAAGFGDLVDDVDRAALTGSYAEWLAASNHEALRDSFDGWLDDDIAFARPWGFDLDSFEVPIHIWQGAHDRMVPFAHGQWLASHVRHACPHLLPEHGHLSLGVAHFGVILDEMLKPANNGS
jgi:pimeloyl-ACP methyl ester carboxylesterase